MTERVDLLDDGAQGRPRRVALVGGALTLAVVAGGVAVRSALPTAPVDVAVAAIDGTAIEGDSFVRLHILLRADGVRSLDAARLTVAGTTQRGMHPPAFDRQGRMSVAVDVTPACADVAVGVRAGLLDLQLRDTAGGRRRVQLAVPPDGPLERLVRYRCRQAPS